MTLAYTGSISVSSATLQDSCYDTVNNLLYVVENSSNTFRKFNLGTLSQVGSNITVVTNPTNICMINSASAVIPSAGSGSISFVEVLSGYTQTYSGGLAVTTTNHAQQIASDLTNQTALQVTATNNKLVSIVASNFGIGQVAPLHTYMTSSGVKFHCVISKGAGTGRFIVGADYGRIYEMDILGNVYNEIVVQLIPGAGIATPSGVYPELPTVHTLALDNNLLLVGTQNGMFLFDYSTGTQLWNNITSASSNTYMSFSNSASGEVIFNRGNVTDNAVISELDFTIGTPSMVSIRDIDYTDAAGICLGSGIKGNTAWSLQATPSKIRVYTITPRNSTVVTVTVQQPAGTNVQARVIILNDTGGVGTSYPILDTTMQSPGSYRVPAGGYILVQQCYYSHGVQTYFQQSRYAT